MLRTAPPPWATHLWFQYLRAASDKQPLPFGGEARLSHRNILDWAECYPVAFSTFKVETLKRIDAMIREQSRKYQQEQNAKNGRKNLDSPPAHRHGRR